MPLVTLSRKKLTAINIVIDTHMPLVTLSRKRSRLYKKPWITKGIQISILHRDKLYKKYLQNKNEQNFTIYKTYRNKLTHLKDLSRQNYYKHLLIASEGKSSKIWTVINQLLSKNKRSTSSIVPPLKIDGKLITDSKDISNAFAHHFSNVGINMSEKIATTNQHYNETLLKNLPNSIVFEDTTPEEILTEIRSLNNRKSSGNDNIPVNILKLNGVILSPILSQIFNECMKIGIFPNILKTARITPIHKNGDRSNPLNYRPISILTHLSKIFEKIINRRLVNFFEKYNILDKRQYGFRQNFSTCLAISDLCEQLLMSFDKGLTTCCVFLDLAKAFDTVNHNILIAKLSHYGIRGTPLQLIRSYLTNRMQYVNLSGYNSDSFVVKCGVPQGSVLGPLLFLVYVNDLPNASSLNIRMFADDTVLFCSHKYSQNVEAMVNNELHKVSKWFCSNKLSLSLNKTRYMILSKSKTNEPFSVQINGFEIEQTHSYKYLGVIIDDKLKWHDHITYICRKISKFSGLFYRIRSVATTKILLMLYYALVYPHLQYSIIDWGCACKTHLAPLQVIQNKILRCISHTKIKQSVSPKYKQMKILKLYDIHKMELAKFMFKLKNQLLPENFNPLFVSVSAIHKYNTRINQSDNKFLPRERTLFGQQKLEYKGVKIWNNLPNCIKYIPTLSKFSHSLKETILESYQ